MRHPSLLRRLSSLAAPLCAVTLAACSGGDPDQEGGSGDAKNGAALYAEMCASCHGNAAEGAFGPRLVPWTRSFEELASTIDETMPQADPAKCDRACAEDIAAYLTGITVDCEGPRALPRRLRLLTRREYRATVTDLLQASVGASCEADTDCAVTHESCTGGVCTEDPCTLHTFTYDAGGSNPGSVHVAGTFNGWPGTIAAGGWPMAKLPGTSTWYVKHELPAGTHEYKLVIDESQWLADPANPKTTGEFGNSVLDLVCSGAPPAGGGLGFDPARDFPAESRPTGFPFDNNESALVTNVHVDQYWKAASLLADAAMADAVNLLPCDMSLDPEACSEEFVVDFGKRAFRRPLSVEEVSKYKALLAGAPDRMTGVRAVVRTMLSSPLFLYRSELGEPAGDGTYRLTAHETASALSYTFWGTMPDDELMIAADSGLLATPAGIEQQARRLLASPRSRSVLDTFTAQWLGVEKVPSMSKTASTYPEWSEALGASMVEETRRFVGHVFFDGSHRYEDLLLSDTTFVDPALASFYGVSGGEGWTQVASPENRRAGLLGLAGVLAANAYADQSSPIKRGLFVRRSLLCQELPAPPANAATVPQVDPDATTRERFAQHTADPSCKSCHQYIDDLGFGFEKFDAIGRHRDSENGKPIDSSGDMNDVEGLGTSTHAPFDSLRGLSEVLVASKSGEACFAKQTYRFAMGRLESSDDVCGLDELSAAFAKSGGDLQELWIALTQIDEFTRRR